MKRETEHKIELGMVTFVALLMLGFIIFMLPTFSEHYNNLKLYKRYVKNYGEGNCDGIEYFIVDYYKVNYTEYYHSFTSSYVKIMQQYNKCYNNTEITGEGFKTPKDLMNCSQGYDCEDITFTLKCLAERFNISQYCNAYMDLDIGIENKDLIEPNHMGYYCEIPTNHSISEEVRIYYWAYNSELENKTFKIKLG